MEILLKSYRGKIEDLYTFGSIAVVDKDGKIVYSAGDPKEVSFPRSSANLFRLWCLFHWVPRKSSI